MALIFDTWMQDLLALFVVLVTYAFYGSRRLLGTFRKNGIKRDSLRNLFLLNYRLLTIKISFIEFMDEIYNNLKDEKIAGYFQFLSPVVMVRDPEVVEKILIKEFGSFHSHSTGEFLDLKTNPLDGHLFNMSGGEWKALRNRLSPVFTSGRLRNMLALVAEKADKLVDVVPRGEDVLIRDYLSRYTVDVIGSTAFGLDCGALDKPDCQFRKMADRIFRPGKLTMVKALLRVIFPKVAKVLKFKTLDKDLEEFFFSVTKQSFEHRMKTGEKRGDFVDLLLQLRGRGRLDTEGEEASELVLTDKLLTAQSFVFLVAGWESAATAMMFTVYFLAKHKEIQEKLRSHLKDNPVTDYDSLKKARYLDACISEAMRIYSPAAALVRVCNRDYFLEEGVKLEKGTTLIVPSQCIQRDPRYFPEPMEYQPGRFLEGSNILPGTYMPFGEGPRICIAQRFANMEIRMVIARLVDNFELELSPKTREPLEMALDSFTVDVKGGLWITLKEIETP